MLESAVKLTDEQLAFNNKYCLLLLQCFDNVTKRHLLCNSRPMLTFTRLPAVYFQTDLYLSSLIWNYSGKWAG